MGRSAERLRLRTLAAAAGAWLIAILPSHAESCRVDHADLRGPWGQARFSVEIADTVAERARGLMNRTELAPMAGMLFVYQHPQPVAFWMKNTLIPLDMLFFDAAGRLQRIHENAVPEDQTPIPGGDNIQFVLEINGGMASSLGIAPGSELRHPAVAGDAAAWPCPKE